MQAAHNAKHGITPTAITSNGAGSALMLQVLEEAKQRREGGGARRGGVAPTKGARRGSGDKGGGNAGGNDDGGGEVADGSVASTAAWRVGGVHSEPAAKAPPAWIVRVHEEQVEPRRQMERSVAVWPEQAGGGGNATMPELAP